MNPTPSSSVLLRVLGLTLLHGSALAVPLHGGEPDPIFIIERTVSTQEEARDVSKFSLEVGTLMEKIRGKADLLVHAENDDLRLLSWVDAEGLVYLHAQWKMPRQVSTQMLFFVDFMNERLSQWNVTDSQGENAPIGWRKREKEPLLLSTVQQANLPGLTSSSHSAGFGVECFPMKRPPEGAKFVSIRVVSREPNTSNGTTRMNLMLPISQWKPWDGGGAR